MPRGWRGTERLRILMLYSRISGLGLRPGRADTTWRRWRRIRRRAGVSLSSTAPPVTSARQTRVKWHYEWQSPHASRLSSGDGRPTWPIETATSGHSRHTHARAGDGRACGHVGAERGRSDIPHRWRCALGVEKFINSPVLAWRNLSVRNRSAPRPAGLASLG
jgi:hypothetical protein